MQMDPVLRRLLIEIVLCLPPSSRGLLSPQRLWIAELTAGLLRHSHGSCQARSTRGRSPSPCQHLGGRALPLWPWFMARGDGFTLALLVGLRQFGCAAGICWNNFQSSTAVMCLDFDQEWSGKSYVGNIDIPQTVFQSFPFLGVWEAVSLFVCSLFKSLGCKNSLPVFKQLNTMAIFLTVLFTAEWLLTEKDIL